MPRYVCAELSTDQHTCVTWVESESLSDSLALTRQQSWQLTYEVCTPVIIVIAFLLFKRALDRV